MKADFLPGVEVTVFMDDRALPEYEVETHEEDASKTVTAFIEIEPGATFSVVGSLDLDFPHREDRIRCTVAIDGKGARANIRSLAQLPFEMNLSGVMQTVEGVTTNRPFTFAESRTETTDDAAQPEMLEAFRELGQISVKIQRCTTTRKHDQWNVGSRYESAVAGAVPEKALKGRAITHHAKLGDAQPSSTTWVACEYPYGKEPLAIYVFKYRTREGLQSEGIIERTPSPVPLEDRDATTLTQSELLEVVQRMQAEKEAAVKIKKEGQRTKRARSETLAASTPGPDDDEVTIASESSARKKARTAPSTVIDLCDSDDEDDD